jgi:O-antigen/teichoic acid export membrane protein
VFVISRLKNNLAANFVGRGWSAVLSIAFIPLYIRFLGIEAYGIIGVQAALIGVLQLANLGLSATLSRYLALYSGREDTAQQQRDLVATLERFYWAIVAIIGIVVLVLSCPIAFHWVRVQELSADRVVRVIRIMAVTIAAQFIAGFYEGGLKGLQRQVAVNVMTMIADTLRRLGVILILWLVSPTIEAFFIWQAFVTVAEAGTAAIMLRRFIPRAANPGRFRMEVARSVWRFSAGLFATTLTSVAVSQADKIILSKILPLSLFGYYVLAGNVAKILYTPVYPVTTAIRPKFTQLIGGGNMVRLREIYHSGCQLLSVMTLPFGLLIALFARSLLWVWTGNTSTADQTHLFLTLLVLGTSVDTLGYLPYCLQVASGWVRLGFIVNLVVGVIQIPSMLVAGFLFGAYGVASVFILAQVLRVVLYVIYTHRQLLPGELSHWLTKDLGLPLGGALAVLIVARIFVISPEISRVGYFCLLIAMWLAATGVTVMVTPKIRPQVLGLMGELTMRVRRVLRYSSQ